MPARAALITLAAFLLVAAPAAAAPIPGCPIDAGALCTRVTVPLDRANPSLGTVRLLVARRPADGRRQRTLLVLAGGPGESATTTFGSTLDAVGDAVLRRTDVVSFDARGTGYSGLVVCAGMQRDPKQRSTGAAAACARKLGARRGAYTAADQVEDIEAVRSALGIRRLDLYGTSFGTKIALQYAQAHPDRVGRLLLDSVLKPSGPSAIGTEVLGALPRVLRASCRPPRCRFTKDLIGDLAAVVRRVRARETRGTAYDRFGRAHRDVLGPVAILDLLLEGDFAPALRDAMPAAIVAARRGDPAPLLRLARIDALAQTEFRTRDFSSGAYAAGSCEDLVAPWDPAADPATRREQARSYLTGLGPQALFPFDAETILRADYLALCLRWPAPIHPPHRPADDLPDVPMLLVEGRQDLRTPLEDSLELARRAPNAQVLSVPGVGHAVLVSDPGSCSRRVARRFLLRLPTRGARCRGPAPEGSQPAVPPRSLRRLGTVRGLPARVGRTLRAVDRTLDDVVVSLQIGAPYGGGLRGGSYRLADSGVVLRRYAYVPGVAVTTITNRGDGVLLRIGGAAAARGRLRLRSSGAYRGVLGGRAITGRLSAGPPGGA